MSAVFENLSTLLTFYIANFLAKSLEWSAAGTCTFLVQTHAAAKNPVAIYPVVM